VRTEVDRRTRSIVQKVGGVVLDPDADDLAVTDPKEVDTRDPHLLACRRAAHELAREPTREGPAHSRGPRVGDQVFDDHPLVREGRQNSST
jgi:hypothetical protein